MEEETQWMRNGGRGDIIAERGDSIRLDAFSGALVLQNTFSSRCTSAYFDLERSDFFLPQAY